MFKEKNFTILLGNILKYYKLVGNKNYSKLFFILRLFSRSVSKSYEIFKYLLGTEGDIYYVL